ncbi:MAG: rubrerythrin [Desulfuromonadaceae bacterium]|nr:rubrerythrin [Desulfuromonadaceae bacterium]MDD2846877.1 rubrerythrin [Desulfuromonadaceae bacterium]MDD4129145.1 rubrerythrin [Desulfuromonadaceae bacterium]
MSDKAMTLSEQILLEKCRDIELLCKDLYSYFAELYSDNQGVAHIWRKTATEEQNHADQFSLALKLRKDLPCTVLTDAARVESILSSLRVVIAQVKAAPPTLVDALNSAIKLEKYLSEFHVDCVARFEDESYGKMFSAMMSSDCEHIESLQAEYDKLTGAQDWTFTG